MTDAKPKAATEKPKAAEPKPGDVITVTLPSGARVTGKARLVQKLT